MCSNGDPIYAYEKWNNFVTKNLYYRGNEFPNVGFRSKVKAGSRIKIQQQRYRALKINIVVPIDPFCFIGNNNILLRKFGNEYIKLGDGNPFR